MVLLHFNYSVSHSILSMLLWMHLCYVRHPRDNTAQYARKSISTVTKFRKNAATIILLQSENFEQYTIYTNVLTWNTHVDSVLVRLVTMGLGTCNLELPPGDSGDRSDGLYFPAYLGCSDKWSDMLIPAAINLKWKDDLPVYVTKHEHTIPSAISHHQVKNTLIFHTSRTLKHPRSQIIQDYSWLLSKYNVIKPTSHAQLTCTV